jgi:hypothetical protein
VVSLVAELRSHERQAAEELEQEDGRRGAQALRRIPAAITLALLLTDEELDSLEKRAGGGVSVLSVSLRRESSGPFSGEIVHAKMRHTQVGPGPRPKKARRKCSRVQCAAHRT